jgi:hypothetical protein
VFVSGFTFIRNAIKLDYPVKEAILSILPLVDEMVVAVGKSDDDTRNLIVSLGSKIRIIDTKWDDILREGGKVLAVETDKAFDAVNPNADWCFYIQGDECIHEKYHSEIVQQMQKYKHDERVEGLLFDYVHFYGSYDFVGDSRSWYRNEIRIIKNDKRISSWKDAQGFRKEGKKLNVKKIKASVFHYGWVRHPKYQMAKQLEAHKLWHSDEAIAKKFDTNTDFDYSQIDSIERFEGTHPEIMKPRIEHMNWQFNRDPKAKKFGLKTGFLYWIEKLTNWRVGENRNYKIIK